MKAGKRLMATSTRVWQRWLLIAAIFGGAWILLSRPSGLATPRGAAPQVGFRVPSFTLDSLDGTEHSLSDYEGP